MSFLECIVGCVWLLEIIIYLIEAISEEADEREFKPKDCVISYRFQM